MAGWKREKGRERRAQGTENKEGRDGERRHREMKLRESCEAIELPLIGNFQIKLLQRKLARKRTHVNNT